MRALRQTLVAMAAAAVGTVAFAIPAALSAELPKSTQAILKKLEQKPELLSGLDEELKVPQDWIDGAKKEGVVRILGTWDPKQFGIMNAPFRERFPGVKVEYSRANFNARVLRTLIAFKEGRYITDIVTGFGGSEQHFRE